MELCFYYLDMVSPHEHGFNVKTYYKQHVKNYRYVALNKTQMS